MKKELTRFTRHENSSSFTNPQLGFCVHLYKGLRSKG